MVWRGGCGEVEKVEAGSRPPFGSGFVLCRPEVAQREGKVLLLDYSGQCEETGTE